MVLTDVYLENVAKAIGGESFTLTAYGGVGTATDFEDDGTATSLDGEIGTRSSLSTTRADNVVTHSFIRSSMDVVGVGGDTLTAVGLFSAVSSGELHNNVALPSLLHTTNFDIEFDTVFTVSRR